MFDDDDVRLEDWSGVDGVFIEFVELLAVPCDDVSTVYSKFTAVAEDGKLDRSV
jgi:hypothetical protein